MWNNGTMSSEAFKGFVEKASSSLQTELILSKNVGQTFAAPALEEGVGITSAKDISVNEEYPLVCIYSSMAFFKHFLNFRLIYNNLVEKCIDMSKKTVLV